MKSDKESATYEDARLYFLFCTRPGGVVLKELADRLKQSMGDDPYRYEQRDPVSGKRMVYGMPVPDEAPPRPDDNALWDAEKGVWR